MAAMKTAVVVPFAATERRCAKCQQTLPRSDFHVDRHASGGLKRSCKKCSLEQTNRLRADYKARPYNPPAQKICAQCEIAKPISEFQRNVGRPDGHLSRCKECSRERQRLYAQGWRDGHPAYHRPHRLAKYGLSVAEYSAMLAAQGGACAICRCSPRDDEIFCIDHCNRRSPNRNAIQRVSVRGILCKACNSGLGSMRDNVTALRNAADYLERYEAKARKEGF